MTIPNRQPAARGDSALLTPAQVADAFQVDVKTVTKWAQAGKLASIRTPGGHRRYRRSDVEKFLDAWTDAP